MSLLDAFDLLIRLPIGHPVKEAGVERITRLGLGDQYDEYHEIFYR